MPTPSKPIAITAGHRTKKEKAQRAAAEAALATGKAFTARPEVKSNAIAFKEFKRVSSLLKTIGKNDALIEGAINRYCEITAEIIEFEEKRAEFSRGIKQLEDAYEEDREAHPSIDDRIIPTIDYFRTLSSMESSMLSLDKRIMDKRKMLLDLEKENIMTIASQLRTIPKECEPEETIDPMERLFDKKARDA